MADTGFIVAATGTNLDDGGTSWSNPGNITADDGSASAVGLKAASSDLLKATYADLVSLIPAGAAIDGIELQVQASQNSASNVTSTGSLSKNGSTVAGGTRSFSAFTTSPADYTVGGPSDLWDTTWTRDDVVAADFSSFLDVVTTDTRIVSVDAVWVKIYYSADAAAGQSSGSATVAGTGESDAEGAGLAAGTATAAAVGTGAGEGIGSAAGTAAVSGTGAALADATGHAAGTAAAAGIPDVSGTGAGTSAGTSAAVAAGAAIAEAEGLVQGSSAALGLPIVAPGIVGTAAGTSAAAATGEAATTLSRTITAPGLALDHDDALTAPLTGLPQATNVTASKPPIVRSTTLFQ